MEQQWTTDEVAEHLGVSKATVWAYRSRGEMPEPTGMLGRTPWWDAAVIIAWHAGRPRPKSPKGKGNSKPSGSSP